MADAMFKVAEPFLRSPRLLNADETSHCD